VRKVLYFFSILLILSFTYYYKEEILVFYNDYFYSNNKIPDKLVKNEYYRNLDFKYVSNTENFIPNNKQDILNIYYSIINSGMDNFTFYCPIEYTSCIQDVKDIANNQIIISNINNFVHPFNGFKDLETEIDSLGKISVNINRIYDNEMKIILNYKVNEIIKNNIKDDMTLEEKVKVIHDYIINNTKYDENRSDKNIIDYKSDTAYGVLIEGFGLCGGYTDAMMLFLEKFGIESYKIASEHHVWNYVNLDNKWYNLDLTWDDPVSSNGSDILKHDFFLISSEELLKLDSKEHIYDKNVYQS